MPVQAKHPIQPLVTDEHGTVRFKSNAIVRKLLDVATRHGYDLNAIACDGFSREDEMQLAQLIGYSLSGFSELSYVDDNTYEAACAMQGGVPEWDARIEALETKIATLKEAMRPAVAELYRIHPDDLE